MKIGESFSWQILSKNVALKKCDLSFFKYGQTGIPRDIGWFFKCENLNAGESRTIRILYNEKEYFWVLHRDTSKSKRLSLHWNVEMKHLFQHNYCGENDNYILVIKSVAEKEYDIEFVKDFQGAQKCDSEILETVICGKEGKVKEFYSKKYERNTQNRMLAIAIHGTKCMACGFDFKQVYGEIGNGFIEVHHVKPLSSLDDEIEVNPQKDLVCLCSNCHRMIHRNKNKILTIDELKALLKPSLN